MENSVRISSLFLTGLILSALVFSPFVLDLTLSIRFICLSLFLLAVFYFFLRSGQSFHFRLDAVTASYLAYCVFCGMSVIWALNKSEAIFEACKTCLQFFVFIAAGLVLKMQKQYFMARLLEFSVIIFFVLLSVAVSQFVGINLKDKEALYQVTGINGHKNLFASFLFLNLFFLIQAGCKLSKTWRVFAIIAVVISVLLLLLLKTKAVWLAMALCVCLFVAAFLFLFQNKKPVLKFYPWLLVCLVIANVFFLYVLQPVISKTVVYPSENNYTQQNRVELDQERLMLWDKTYTLVHKQPVIGTGAGNWQVYFPDATLNGIWRAEDLNYTFQRPHNDFLWRLSETGIVGLNLFLLFLFALAIGLAGALRLVSDKPEVKWELCLCLAFIAGYQVISFFDFPKERTEHSTWISLIMAIAYHHTQAYASIPLLAGSGNDLPAAGLRKDNRQVSRVVYFMVICLLGFILYVGALRYRGEYYTRKMLDYKYSDQKALLIRAGHSALSFAYTLDPTSLPIHWYIGNAEASFSDYKNALADFETAHRLNPYNRNVLNDLASSYALNGQPEMAKIFYKEASRISPRFDEPKLNLIALYINEKNYEAASACLKTLFHDSERRNNYQKLIDALQKK